MNGVDILSLTLTSNERRAHPAGDDRATDIEVDLAFLVGRLVAGERVSRVKRLVFKQELPISMKSADAATIDDLWSRLSFSALAKPVRTIFRRKGIVVDANVLGLSLLVLPDGPPLVAAQR